MRDALQAFVRRTFGDAAGVRVLDETVFLKKGRQSVGVPRQDSGTAGTVAHCQRGVFLTDATATGHVVLDRRLYLPCAWPDAPPRCTAAGVPATVTVQTLPALGRAMSTPAPAPGSPCAWVTADAGAGKDPPLRAALAAAGQRYVIAGAQSTPVWATRPPATPLAAVVATWDAACWQRLSVGAGSTGPHVYDWAAPRGVVSRAGLPGPDGWLLARRSRAPPHERAYDLSNAPAATPLATLAQGAGTRGTVAHWFEEAKGALGLDQEEVRTWRAWQRRNTLRLLAHTFLAWQRRQPPAPPRRRALPPRSWSPALGSAGAARPGGGRVPADRTAPAQPLSPAPMIQPCAKRCAGAGRDRSRDDQGSAPHRPRRAVVPRRPALASRPALLVSCVVITEV